MNLNTYSAGNTVRMTLTVLQCEGGGPINANTLVLKLRYPNMTVVDLSATIVQDGTGLYHADLTVNAGGNYVYQWIGSGNVGIEASKTFCVTPAPIPL
jgi:hypothetical protein